MNPNDPSKERADSWDLLARDLLGEEADPTEASDSPAEEAKADAEAGSERGDTPPESDQRAEEPPLEESVELLGEGDAAVEEPLAEMAPPEGDEPTGTELSLEMETAELGSEGETDDEDTPRGKPRRSRRGRRRRSRRSSDEPAETTAEAAEATVESEPIADDASEFDVHYETIDDGEDNVSSDSSDAKSKAIPTWAEAISHLSRGPQEGATSKVAGSRPRRRRRRSKPPQS